jgi:hypothetical protein
MVELSAGNSHGFSTMAKRGETWRFLILMGISFYET